MARFWSLLADAFSALWGGGVLGAGVFKSPEWGTHVTTVVQQDIHWLPDPFSDGGRRYTGVGLLCPLHGNHRIHLFFFQPLDGLPAVEGVTLYDVENLDEEGDFSDVSILDRVDITRPITTRCGASFRIVAGEVRSTR